jgi:hypothetical protein
VRTQITAIEMKDVGNIDLVLEKAFYFQDLFDALDDIENLKKTRTRAENLAEKRHEKNNMSKERSDLDYNPIVSNVDVRQVGRPAPGFTDHERRIASISDPAKNSSGGEQFYASLEEEIQRFGNMVCRILLRRIFKNNITLDWVQNRAQPPTLLWANKYSYCRAVLMYSALAAEVKLGHERVSARTDGGLQIILHHDNQKLAWDRSYYEIALEVYQPMTALIL